MALGSARLSKRSNDCATEDTANVCSLVERDAGNGQLGRLGASEEVDPGERRALRLPNGEGARTPTGSTRLLVIRSRLRFSLENQSLRLCT